MEQTIGELVNKLTSGQLSSAALLERCIAVAERSDAVFITLNADQARREAAQIDAARGAGEKLPRYAGIPITLKDLFAVRGEITTAGSRVLASAPPAVSDAPVVQHLRDAGFIFLGRVNMSEFAFSGTGANPHYGTPLSIWDRDSRRLPGGSSSGSGVCVAEGIVPGSIGSDTAGSTRIPAAFNGVVGYKPSYGRFPLEGIFPLSPTTDAPGPLAHSVACCYLLDAAMEGNSKPPPLAEKYPDQINLLIPQANVLSDLDSTVQETFARTVANLQAAGCRVDSRPLPALDGLLTLFQTTPLATHEAWQAHRQRITERGDEYDPFVSWRISSGGDISDADYKKAVQRRTALIAEFNQQVEGFDAVMYPTVACIPPRLSEIATLESARPVNFRCLRNTSTVNYFDGCSISIPCHAKGAAPVGLMLSATKNRDFALFQTAAAVEKLLTKQRC